MSFKLRLLLLTISWIAIASILLASMYLIQQQNTEQRTKQELHRDLASHMRDDNPLMDGADYSSTALKSIFHTLMLLGPDFEIYFLNAEGKITTHAAPDEKIKVRAINLKPIYQFLDNSPFPIYGDDPRDPDQKTVFSVAPIQEGDTILGYLYVVIGSEKHDQINSQESNTPLLLTISAALILMMGLAIALYVLVKRTLLKPIEDVTRKLRHQSEDNFRLNPDFINQVPELQPVANQLYLMSQHMQQQFLDLQQQETHRHDMLMQLSHDLKTPLSSVLGYLETWQIQHPMTDKLIETAYRNALRLSEQLNQQLQLAKQAVPRPEPHFEAVPLRALIMDVSDSLAVDAQKKQLSLSITVEDNCIVAGDKQLLRRLFSNIFENAIRHAKQKTTVTIIAQQDAQNRLNIIQSNHVDEHAEKGSLGMGNKIIESILLLHNSQIKRKESDSEYEQTFSLPLIKPSF